MQRDCSAGTPEACFALAQAYRGTPNAEAYQRRGEFLVRQRMQPPPAPPPPTPTAPPAKTPDDATTAFQKSLGASQVPDRREDETRVKAAHVAWVEHPTLPLDHDLDLRVLTKNFGLDFAPYSNLASSLLRLEDFQRTPAARLSIGLGLPNTLDYQKFLNILQADLLAANKHLQEWSAQEDLAEKNKQTLLEQNDLLQRWTHGIARQYRDLIEARKRERGL